MNVGAPEPELVILEWFEMRMAAIVGMERHLQSLQKHPRSERDFTKNRWDRDIESALAEVAVGKYLEIYWPGSVNVGPAHDVGRYQVRHSEYPNGHLIVRPRDKDWDIFVFVTGCMGHYNLHGWLSGHDAKAKGDQMNPGALGESYWVPREKLNSIQGLKQDLKEVGMKDGR